MLNRKAFYDALRGGAMFPRSITPALIAGLDRLVAQDALASERRDRILEGLPPA